MCQIPRLRLVSQISGHLVNYRLIVEIRMKSIREDEHSQTIG